MGHIERALRELRQNISYAMFRNIKLQCHSLIAEANGLIEKTHEIGDIEETVRKGIFGIEQPDIGPLDMKIIIQNAEIEQHLDIMLLHGNATMGILAVALDKHVTPRLLLHEKPHVCRHEVDTALQSQLLTDKGRFEDSFRQVIMLAQLPDNTKDVSRLPCGVFLELGAIEVHTRSILQRPLTEGADKRLGSRELWIVDNIAETGTGIVTQEDSLGVSSRLHATEEIEQRMVAILLKA